MSECQSVRVVHCRGTPAGSPAASRGAKEPQYFPKVGDGSLLVIRGRFDPFRWAADPNRRTDVFDSHGLLTTLTVKAPREDMILGMPGSVGTAEGLVRRLDSPEDGEELEPGEVLVASQPNIGWTLFFPRASAIVTDIGAPLSHAAIVARELGIPAVVNCGDATTRLRTGDRVRVDGVQGTVEILESEA